MWTTPTLDASPAATMATGAGIASPFRSTSGAVEMATPPAPPARSRLAVGAGASGRVRSSTVTPAAVPASPTLPDTATSRTPPRATEPRTRGANVVNSPANGCDSLAPLAATTFEETPYRYNVPKRQRRDGTNVTVRPSSPTTTCPKTLTPAGSVTTKAPAVTLERSTAAEKVKTIGAPTSTVDLASGCADAVSELPTGARGRPMSVVVLNCGPWPFAEPSDAPVAASEKRSTNGASARTGNVNAPLAPSVSNTNGRPSAVTIAAGPFTRPVTNATGPDTTA